MPEEGLFGESATTSADKIVPAKEMRSSSPNIPTYVKATYKRSGSCRFDKSLLYPNNSKPRRQSAMEGHRESFYGSFSSVSQSSEYLHLPQNSQHGRRSIVSLMDSSGYHISLDHLPREVAEVIRKEQEARGCKKEKKPQEFIPTGFVWLDSFRKQYNIKPLEAIIKLTIRKKRLNFSFSTNFLHKDKYHPPKVDDLVNSTHFNREEIKYLYRELKQQCPSGKLNRKQFVSAMGFLFPMGNTSLFAFYVFNAMDEGHTGVVTIDKILRTLSVLTRGDKRQWFEWIFRLYDVDNDGVLSQQDLLAVTASIYDLCGETVTPKVSPNTPVLKVEQIMEQIQPENVQAISSTEFYSFLQSKFQEQPLGVFDTHLY